MTTVIAGSTGLVGTALTSAFESAGHEVIEINRSVVNLLDLKATKAFIKQVRPNLVVDAAAKVGGIGANNSTPVEFLSDNIRIQSNLMEAAHEAEVQKFVFLGSSCIYPRDCAQPIKEEFLMTGPLESTNSAYAIAKIAGIELINSYRKEYGAKWISLMPTNLYGPRDNFDLLVHKGEPNRSEFFSAIVIEKVSIDTPHPIYDINDIKQKTYIYFVCYS